MNGILNLNKPPGWTSFDAVAFVRRHSAVRRVGHAGTLDPAATGVLPILLGQATRLTEYLVDTTKSYLATIELGVETDTYDHEGAVLETRDASDLPLSAIETALDTFRGEIDQVPPAFSAIKREGQPSYKAARKGAAVSLPSRRVIVHRLQIKDYQPPFLQVDVECGKGFYVRSLAHDLGQRLGVGGTLAALQRTRVGSFRIEDAVDIETLRSEFDSGTWQDRLYAPDEVLLGWRAAIIGPDNEAHLRNGRRLTFEGISEGSAQLDRCRAYNAAGDFLAILRSIAPAQWQPEKVFL
jgi:tRNA pseudouridine55 synthase